MRSVFCALLSLLVALSVSGQVLTIGNDVTPGAPDAGIAPPHTSIDLASPASATGTVTTVKYSWTTDACPNALKIKFFRRDGNNFTVTAERGPFTSSTTGTLTLTPPVAVSQGDLIGVTRLTACGTARASSTASDGFLVFASEVTGTVSMSEAHGQAAQSLALYGTGIATERVDGVITVAGSTRGAFGSNFKTSLQLHNPSAAGTMTGKIVFRPQASGYASITTLGYSLGPGQIKAYEDVVSAMGATGIGSIDLVVPADQGAPVVNSRIYNDAGPQGTSGLSQDLIICGVGGKRISRILGRGTTGYLFTPIDPVKTRFNIGIRTLYTAATIEVTLTNEAGATVRTETKSYPPNWFEQVEARAFIGTISGNETLKIHVVRGEIIVYGATTDNVTNDPAVQFAVVEFSEGG